MKTIIRILCTGILLAFPVWGMDAQNLEKSAALAEKDPTGLIMSITAASVVFTVLLILFICYKWVGIACNSSLRMPRRHAASGNSPEKMSEETAIAIAMALDRETGNEVKAAISMALHQYLNECVHDNESFVITIRKSSSAWNTKVMRELPVRK